MEIWLTELRASWKGRRIERQLSNQVDQLLLEHIGESPDSQLVSICWDKGHLCTDKPKAPTEEAERSVKV